MMESLRPGTFHPVAEVPNEFASRTDKPYPSRIDDKTMALDCLYSLIFLCSVTLPRKVTFLFYLGNPSKKLIVRFRPSLRSVLEQNPNRLDALVGSAVVLWIYEERRGLEKIGSESVPRISLTILTRSMKDVETPVPTLNTSLLTGAVAASMNASTISSI